MRLSEALDQAKYANEAIARKGWNDKGMFVYYVQANAYKATSVVAKKVFGENALVDYGAYFAILAADNKVYPWVPSQADMDAEDWIIMEF